MTLLRRHRRRYHGGCVIAQCTSNSVRAAAYERGNLGITRVQTLKTNFTENTAIIAATGHYAIPLYMFRVGLFAAVITVMPRDLSTRIIFIYAFRNARNPFCFNDGEHVWFRWASIVPEPFYGRYEFNFRMSEFDTLIPHFDLENNFTRSLTPINIRIIFFLIDFT